jgi:hypothetical protein
LTVLDRSTQKKLETENKHDTRVSVDPATTNGRPASQAPPVYHFESRRSQQHEEQQEKKTSRRAESNKTNLHV